MSLWLGGLSIADVNELRAATPEIRERNAETLVATTQGNPLFLVQLVADNRDGGSPSATPGTLHEAVARRVERLWKMRARSPRSPPASEIASRARQSAA